MAIYQAAKAGPAPSSLLDSLRLPADSAKIELLSTSNQSAHTTRPDLAVLRPKQELVTNQYWVIGILLLILILLAWIRVSHQRYFGQLFKSLTSNRFIKQFIREERIFTKGASMPLLLIFFLTGSLFVSQLVNSLDGDIDTVYNLDFFIRVLAGVIGLVLAKMLIIRISGFLFKIEEHIKEYLFNIFLFNTILGLLLLPIVITTAFVTSPYIVWLMYAGCLLFASFFMFRVAKMFYLGITTTSLSVLYIILYICTLEFLPLIVLVRICIDVVG